jgi:multiple sugar transport system permease protein
VKSRKARGRIGDLLTYLVFAVALVFFGGPLLWVLSLSIRTQQEVYITSLRLIPETPTLENYVEVLAELARLAPQHVDGLHRHPGADCDLDA